ncbi:MAG: sulfotransferase, partial [Rhodospirillaceae bacterium]|nr:sulfotransferase [Rhodospirillaceae bacterium]
FAAAELHDRLGDFDRAFGHARAANALSGRVYDPAAAEAQVEGLIAAAKALPGAAPPEPEAPGGPPRPLFVVGMPRSGTSLMERVLAAHPAVEGVGEHRALEPLVHALPAPDPQASGPAAAHTDAQTDALSRAGRAYRASLPAAVAGAVWAVDKTPLNLLHLPWAARMLPDSRFLWLRRDPRDTGLSCFFQSFAEGHGFAFDLGHCGHFQGLVARLHRAWGEDLGTRLATVDYEDLVTEFGATARRALGHLGLGWDDGLRRFHEGGPAATATASHHQIRRPLFTGSIGRWRHYAHHLGPLTAALAEARPRLPAPRPAA